METFQTTISLSAASRTEKRGGAVEAERRRSPFCVSGVYLLGMGSWVTEHLETRKKNHQMIRGQMQTEHV